MGVKGRIHSLESFGTQEGPGIRYVVFMQGCPARCRYCHNPDTWAADGGRLATAEEIFSGIRKCREYFAASGGGVTVSGGEPLRQAAFLEELFTLCRTEGIHTAIDTGGFITARELEGMDALIGLTDLFIIDLKWADPARHRELTGRGLEEPLALIGRLEQVGKPYWIRQVLVPELNDTEADLMALGRLLKPLGHCERFELLPYHTLGRHKWEALGLAYPLAGWRAATEEDVARVMQLVKTV